MEQGLGNLGARCFRDSKLLLKGKYGYDMGIDMDSSMIIYHDISTSFAAILRIS